MQNQTKNLNLSYDTTNLSIFENLNNLKLNRTLIFLLPPIFQRKKVLNNSKKYFFP